jgi:hypothetical protein
MTLPTTEKATHESHVAKENDRHSSTIVTNVFFFQI